MFRFFSIFAALTMSISVYAQKTIGFDGNDFKSVGIFDLWEDSPFRKGELEGNYAVIDNYLKDGDNASEKILAVQRSRFGSNTFGIRIDLPEPFELTPQPKKVSVMVHRPYEGRVMIIGLGRRSDKPWQSAQTVQFTMISKTDIAPDSWQDVTVQVKGVPGVMIHSLVIVPDCESPHEYKEDKICHIDNISYDL